MKGLATFVDFGLIQDNGKKVDSQSSYHLFGYQQGE